MKKKEIKKHLNKVIDTVIESEFWNNKLLKTIGIILGTAVGVLFIEKHLIGVITSLAVAIAIAMLVDFLRKNIESSDNEESFQQLHSQSMILGDELVSVINDCEDKLGLILGNVADYSISPNWSKEGSMDVFKYKVYKSNADLDYDILETSLKNMLLEHLKDNKVRGVDNHPYRYENVHISRINILDIKDYDMYYEVYLVFACEEYAKYFIKHKEMLKLYSDNNHDNNF